ncbi:MAG TPA: glycosyltransferase family 39 protein [Patescibacteria group bacterium]|nr:glycosyltransferase family 39 protein [Patescibacteria group bacterium]
MKKVKEFLAKTKKWIKENPREFWILIFILLLAAFARLYRIDRYMTFLGDEGRDVIVVRRLLVEGHPPLIGPGTSIGNMYLGPLYYYMMAPALLVAGFSPLGPAVQIALLGVATVFLVWYLARLWFGKTAAAVSAALYALSPIIIIYSRSSWNPNIMPFFSILVIYSLWKIYKDRSYVWLTVMSISFAFVLHSHYLGLLLAPTIFLFWALSLRNIWKNKIEKKIFFKKSAISGAILVALMSPLFFFDLRHNWINFKAMYTFFTVRQETVSIRPWKAIPKIPEMLNLVSGSVVAAKNPIATPIASVAIIFSVVWLFFKAKLKNKNFRVPAHYWLLFSWLGFALLGFGLYKQNIYDHYFGFIFAVPILLIGDFVSRLLAGSKILKLLGVAFFVFLIAVNLMGSPLKKEPNSLLQRTVKVAAVIEKESGGAPFNIAVIAENNYEDAYKYFLLKDNSPVMDIDAQRTETVASQLFVVCELIPNTKCDPTHSPKAQIANFGWSKIDAQWEVEGVIIYRLIHSQ